jgi:hypothetical protein
VTDRIPQPLGGHAEAIALVDLLSEVLDRIRVDIPGRPDATFSDLYGRQLDVIRAQLRADWRHHYLKVATRRPVVVVDVTGGETINP